MGPDAYDIGAHVHSAGLEGDWPACLAKGLT